MIPLKKFIPGIAWFFLVLILLCLPGYDLPKADDWMSAIYFDKWVHTGLFSVMTFLFIMPLKNVDIPLAKKKSTALKICIALSIWGLTTEFIQKYFIAGRSFDLWDWGADSVGVLFALIICSRLYLRISNYKNQ